MYFVFVFFQVKKLLNKPLVRESCHYRKLTDRPKDEPSPILTSDALIDNFLGVQREWWLELRGLFVTLEYSRWCYSGLNHSVCPAGNQSLLPSLKIKRQSEDSGESSSLIVYKGAMVDVGSMMQKLEKSGKTREEIEQKLMQQDIKMGNNLIYPVFNLYLNEDVSVFFQFIFRAIYIFLFSRFFLSFILKMLPL